MHLRGEKSVFPSVCDMHFQRCLPTYFVDAKRHQQSATEKAYDVTLLLLSCTNVRGAHIVYPKRPPFPEPGDPDHAPVRRPPLWLPPLRHLRQRARLRARAGDHPHLRAVHRPRILPGRGQEGRADAPGNEAAGAIDLLFKSLRRFVLKKYRFLSVLLSVLFLAKDYFGFRLESKMALRLIEMSSREDFRLWFFCWNVKKARNEF